MNSNFGFIRVATLSPDCRVNDTLGNAEKLSAAICGAFEKGAQIIVTPELSVTCATCGDLFRQNDVLRNARNALGSILKKCREVDALYVVGLPLRVGVKLFDCAAVCHRDNVLGFVPKSVLSASSELNDARIFTSGDLTESGCTARFANKEVPFGTNLLFSCEGFTAAVEIGSDAYAVVPPSVSHVTAGADIILNPAADAEIIGREERRRELVKFQSARLHCAYLLANAGEGESTTDMVFAGHMLIAENGTILSECEPFESYEGTIMEIDVERLRHDRAADTFPAAVSGDYRTVSFPLVSPKLKLHRHISQSPMLPEDKAACDARCKKSLDIQSAALAKRLAHAHCKKAVIGISGGLDSCLALIVSVLAMKRLGRPASDVIAVTMPCFGTTKRTRSNAEVLTEKLGAALRTVTVGDMVLQHFKDIGHDPENHNVTFENAQARARTYVLMDIANDEGGMVIGTGDLSELALGWATYNGDHMSMYGVNGGITKTFIRKIVRFFAENAEDKGLADVLLDILDTPVSPELLPAADGEIAQKTEDLVGPYELHDFILYYALRWGFSKEKIFYLMCAAFDGAYDEVTMEHWLENFYRRFTIQQYKRSCLPDGPKVGSVGISPRGGFVMPSDATLW